MRHTFVLMIIVILIGSALRSARAQPYSHLFIFGDSLSDTGNIFMATGNNIPESPPYFMGRFANGPVWVEGLAERFGLQVAPSLAGGTNFAFGGAETGQEVQEIFETEVDVLIPSLRVQVLNFLGGQFTDDPFGDADPSALYIVWGGHNDLRKAVIAGTTDPAAEARTAVDDLVAALRDLAEAGAAVFLVPNLPDLGRTPESRALGPAAMALATDISVHFNTALNTALDAIEAESDVSIFRLDIFTRLEQAIADPAAFGFTNVTDTCLTGDAFMGGMPCATPEAHLFWDTIHPTAAAHAILAAEAFMVTAPPLTVIPGNANPSGTVTVSGAEQDVPVLQARLSTAAETIRLTRVTLALTDRMGDEGLVETLRAQLVNDVNENGQFDPDEPILATGDVQQVVDTLALDITSPLDIPPDSAVHLLVTLDINVPTRVATVTGMALWSLVPLVSLAFWSRYRRPTWRLPYALLILMLGCDLGNHFTDGDDADSLTLTVAIPAEGLTAQDATGGQLSEPAVAIVGRTLSITP